MNQNDIDDLKGFVYLLVQKSVKYELNPVECNLKLLNTLTKNFYMSLPKKAKDVFRKNLSEVLTNIKKGFTKLKELEKKRESRKPLNLYLIEKQIKNIKRGM